MPAAKFDPGPHERATSLFGREPSVTEQYFEVLRKKSTLDPEKALMLAVLQDAVHCFQKYFAASNRKSRTLFEEAEEWIVTANGGWAFSFDNICEALGLNPQYVRSGLLQWKENQLRGHAGISVRPEQRAKNENANRNGSGTRSIRSRKAVA